MRVLEIPAVGQVPNSQLVTQIHSILPSIWGRGNATGNQGTCSYISCVELDNKHIPVRKLRIILLLAGWCVGLTCNTYSVLFTNCQCGKFVCAR